MVETELSLEKLCFGGAGLGRLEGKACFVPFTAPGDRARIRVVREKRSFVEAELVELIEPAPCRVAPVCPIFGSCGGCDWQHLPYREQLRHKGLIFAETLSRIGKVAPETIRPVLAAPEPFGYRSRIKLKVARQGRAVMLGFFRAGTHQVVDAPAGCPIAHPLLNRIASEFRPLLDRLPVLSCVTGLDLAVGDPEGSLAMVHCAVPEAVAVRSALLAARAELPSLAALLVRSGSKAGLGHVFGPDWLSYRIPSDCVPGSPRELELRFSKGGFSQVNFAQNLAMIRCIAELAGFSGNERVLDLYCGNGNLSIPLAPLVAEMTGVEGYAPSIEDARANARANGCANAGFRVSDAARAVDELARRGERFDLVLLDPPRSGAEQAARIAQLKPRSIVYVSCDPPTLARDLAQLAGAGYRVACSQPIDMFPQTYHLESVTLLQRN